ncbi:hypothetical protein JGH11_11020 [Dysgonomonas sp. Marseille-P4677]|uniref:hypothetical protein n=1 Tax=Dysgonomonas sp. Marseille-P4677 TaxID=2364790 RepID=UPI001912B02C|nr:hypothetical protein [Dysgonomonas sp. Marseille-P4677]MBK5721405.1 hypothetical protein [Dysgonomonas sp. Marseille-P4677]
MSNIELPDGIKLLEDELIKDLAKAIDYLEVMNKDVNNVTLNSFIPKIRAKYNLKSELKP